MISSLDRLREELRRLRWLNGEEDVVSVPPIPDEARPEVSRLRRRLERLPATNRPESKG